MKLGVRERRLSVPNIYITKLFLLIGWVALFGAHRSEAFPEMIRHGYSNCITCHVSPNGGGVITPYGRALSQEVLSTWAAEDESSFLYGIVKPPDLLVPGGDFRALQTYMNSATVEMGQFIVMQADAEAAFLKGDFQFDISLGRQEPKTFNYTRHEFKGIYSRRWWLGYRPTQEISFRAGRFQPAYGINTPNHFLVTKRNIGFDEGSETYNVEAAWIRADYEFFLTESFFSDTVKRLYAGVYARGAINLAEHYKVGLSYSYAGDDINNRHLAGPYAVLGFSPSLYLLAEIDFQNLMPKEGSPSRTGIVDYLRLNYEVMRGLIFFGTQELAQLTISDSATRLTAFGLGVQWFPRPHAELEFSYQKRKMNTPNSSSSDYLWLLMHYYL